MITDIVVIGHDQWHGGIGAAFKLRLPKGEVLGGGTRTVLPALHFYHYADEHFGWAETAKTEHERAIFSQMAAAWLEVAQKWEIFAKQRAPQVTLGASKGRRRLSSSPAWPDEPTRG